MRLLRLSGPLLALAALACGARSDLFLRSNDSPEGGGGGSAQGAGGEGGAVVPVSGCVPGGGVELVADGLPCRLADLAVDDTYVYFPRGGAGDSKLSRVRKDGVGEPEVLVGDRSPTTLVTQGDGGVFAVTGNTGSMEIVRWDKASGATTSVAGFFSRVNAITYGEGSVFFVAMEIVMRFAADGSGGVPLTGGADPDTFGSIAVAEGSVFYPSTGDAGQRAISRARWDGGATQVVVGGGVPSGSFVVDDATVYFSTIFGNVATVPTTGGMFSTLSEGFAFDLSTDGVALYASTHEAGDVVRILQQGGARTKIQTGAVYAGRTALDATCVYWIEHLAELDDPACTGVIRRAPK